MALGIVLALLVIAASLCWLYLRHQYSYWARHNVPHEKPTFLLGNLSGIGRTVHFRDLLQRLYRRYKGSSPIIGLYTVGSRAVVPIDLELIKQMLIKDFSNFHDRGIFHSAEDDPLTAHLFAIEGAQWRAMRNKLSPVFTSGKMKYMFPTVVAVGRELNATCGASVAKDSIVEVKDLCARFTTDVIGSVAFGIQCSSLEDPQTEFRLRVRDVFEKQRHSRLVTNFIMANPRMARKLRMKFFPDDMSEFFINVVRSTVAYRQQNNVKRNDFMNMLIEMLAKDQQLAEASAKGDIDLTQGLTLMQLTAQAFLFFIAGFDTSSSTMSFCLYELALNEAVQQQAREEIVRVLAEHKNELTYEAMGSMHYLDQVVAETLRKYPIVSELIREVTVDYHIPDTEVTINSGMRVFVPVHAIHHDPDLYPEPEKFDPTRFTPEAVIERHPCAYLPFGDGPRNCIGLRFGKMQTKVGLIHLLKDYKFSRCTRTEVPIEYNYENFLLSAKNGLYLRVEPLK